MVVPYQRRIMSVLSVGSAGGSLAGHAGWSRPGRCGCAPRQPFGPRAGGARSRNGCKNRVSADTQPQRKAAFANSSSWAFDLAGCAALERGEPQIPRSPSVPAPENGSFAHVYIRSQKPFLRITGRAGVSSSHFGKIGPRSQPANRHRAGECGPLEGPKGSRILLWKGVSVAWRFGCDRSV